MAKLDWERHRAEIERLYLLENKRLDEVVVIMKRSAAFHASKAAYERKLKDWRIRKNRRREEWRAVIRETKRRHELNRASEVFLGHNLCSEAKLRKKFRQHGFTSTYDRMRPNARSPSVEVSKDMLVCSPGPSVPHMEWSGDMPWIDFRGWIQAQIDSASHDWFGAQSISLGLSPQNIPLGPVGQFTITELGASLPWDKTAIMRTIQSSSRVTAMLGLIMPEEYDGQHCGTVERLYGLQKNEAISEYIMLQLFFLSNNFTRWDNSGAYICLEKHDEHVLGILRAFGLSTCANFLKRVLSSSKTTSAAISEQLFASALRAGDLKLLEFMLEAGMDANLVIETRLYGLVPSLEVAADLPHSVSLEAVSLLLRHLSKDNWQTHLDRALQRAARKRHGELCDLLIASGAVVLPSTIENAIRGGDDTVLRKLLDTGADIDAAIYINHDELTPIGLAAKIGHAPMIRTLLQYSADVERLQFSSIASFNVCVPTTPIGIAATAGHIICTRILLQANALINLANSSYASPLLLACQRGDSEVIMTLLEAGADVQSADIQISQRDWTRRDCLIDILLHNAGYDLPVLRSLLARGARINSGTLFEAICKNASADLVALLLDYGAPQKLPAEGDSAFERALREGKVDIARMLLSAGAPSTIRINRINMTTVDFLEEVELLDTLIATTKETVLTSAIELHDWPLADRLLQHSVQVNPSHCLDHETITPLEAAFATGNVDFAKCLVQRGACVTGIVVLAAVWGAALSESDDVLRLALQIARSSEAYRSWLENYGCTAIYIAICSGERTLVRLLLDAGADPRGRPLRSHNQEFVGWDQTFSSWWIKSPEWIPVSVLDAAVARKDLAMLQMLLEKRSWKRHCTGDALITAVLEGGQNLIQALLDAGAAPDQICGSAGVLQAAIHRGKTNMLRNLIQAGANVNKSTRGAYGRTPLQMAVENGDWESMEILLEAHADVNAPAAHDLGLTALQFAAAKGHLRIAGSLLDAGADINAPGGCLSDRTALETASEHGRIDMLQLLISRGAQVDGNGRVQYIRAIKLAEGMGHNAVARMLKRQRDWTAADYVQYDQEVVEDAPDPFDYPYSNSEEFDSDRDVSEDEVDWEDDNDTPQRSGSAEQLLDGRISQAEWYGSELAPSQRNSDAETTTTRATIEDSTGIALDSDMDLILDEPLGSDHFWQTEARPLSIMDLMPDIDWNADLVLTDFLDFGECMVDTSDCVQDLNEELNSM